MKTTFELNQAMKDCYAGRVTKVSPVVEIFSAMAQGKDLSKWGAKANSAVAHIKDLGVRAGNGDFNAISELNTIRRFAIETPILEEAKLLGVFGSYKAVGFDETIEREVFNHVGNSARIQANNGDVRFPSIVKETYPVPTFTVSAGYEVDYRRVALGDMEKENEGMAKVKTEILNTATLAIVEKVYKAIMNATGVKYAVEAAGLTKEGVDKVLNQVRRYGRPTVIGDYALLGQFTPWAGYDGQIKGHQINGVSEKVMNEVMENGKLSWYNGALLSEMENPYNEYELTADGKDYETLLPSGLGFIVPAGAKSPIETYTRGGLTSFTGNDVKTGRVMTRFDLEVGCDVAKGQENRVGLIHDTNLDSLRNE